MPKKTDKEIVGELMNAKCDCGKPMKLLAAEIQQGHVDNKDVWLVYGLSCECWDMVYDWQNLTTAQFELIPKKLVRESIGLWRGKGVEVA